MVVLEEDDEKIVAYVTRGEFADGDEVVGMKIEDGEWVYLVVRKKDGGVG